MTTSPGSPPCRKIRYEDEQAARLCLLHIIQSRSPGVTQRERTVYQCPACGWWHLTSQPQHSTARRRRVRDRQREQVRSITELLTTHASTIMAAFGAAIEHAADPDQAEAYRLVAEAIQRHAAAFAAGQRGNDAGGRR